MGLKEIQWTPPPPRFISLIRRSADFFPPGAVAAACFNPFVNTPAMRKKFKFIPQLSGANATRGWNYSAPTFLLRAPRNNSKTLSSTAKKRILKICTYLCRHKAPAASAAHKKLHSCHCSAIKLFISRVPPRSCSRAYTKSGQDFTRAASKINSSRASALPRSQTAFSLGGGYSVFFF